jgi:pimeloyl-ACP methyl ester carboxylesterase
MPHVEVNDVSLYYEEDGTGEPLLLLHGAGSAIDEPVNSWAGLRGLLGAHFRTLFIEHRGHGRSNNPQNRFDYPTLAEDILAFADSLGITAFHLAGVSDGAIVGLHFGINDPQRLRSLVLLGVNYENDHETRLANKSWSHLPSEPDDSPVAARLSERHDRAGKPPGYWRSLYEGLVDNVAVSPSYSEEVLARITTPTLLVAGENDGYANLRQLSP